MHFSCIFQCEIEPFSLHLKVWQTSNAWQIASFLWRKWCRERSFAKCYFTDKKGGKMRIESKKQKISLIISCNLCSYECEPKQKYWKRKINHLKVFIFIFFLQSISFLSFFLSKTEIRLRYRKISTMMFLSIKKVFYTPQNNYGNTTVRVLGFAEILTSF